MSRNREETSASNKQAREEVILTISSFEQAILSRMGEIAHLQKNQLDTFAQHLTNLTGSNEKRLETMRNTTETRLLALTEETTKQFRELSESLSRRMSEMAAFQVNQLDNFAKQITGLTQSNEQKLEQMRSTVEQRIKDLQNDNAQKLEQMRMVVDEKLHATLERRLGESFKLVSERLELVHKGLGEMQTLAAGVGDLKKVLTNVKTRGSWGEVQLGNILEDILTPDQYSANVAVKKGSERVEYAIKLPGSDQEHDVLWLPIDAKFPMEDYHRILDAYEQGDTLAVEQAGKQLDIRIRNQAKEIASKYIEPPATTDFAIMFLPTEGLYAEVLRRPGLFESLRRDYRVSVTGPTTLAALINSLSVGFRTLAIQKRSSEVWVVLGAVKAEFGKFGAVLEKTQKKLQEASNTIEDAARRSRAMERKLRSVEALPENQAAIMLGEDIGEEIAAEADEESESV
ncbi:MAG TPA: DNA recombination protein RmuC [Syntrophomonadaceae bacterium]|nr:DNA recombination protein RmuC [Syntrophomonadaceae bacterium]